MGEKTKAHRTKVSKRNRKFNTHIKQDIKENLQILLNVRHSVWEKVIENGFSTIDEAWEKSPWIFCEVFPGESLETIEKGLKLEWIREKEEYKFFSLLIKDIISNRN